MNISIKAKAKKCILAQWHQLIHERVEFPMIIGTERKIADWFEKFIYSRQKLKMNIKNEN